MILLENKYESIKEQIIVITAFILPVVNSPSIKDVKWP
ncbi:hypothetical protein L21TH_1484 [Caldisalinibacter kiritimatiensis]|uniref:Uncharacterized protein n=1 Tax=Caldisalinibacter kiritimatiensis TaxID=1304284 RepID=R1CUZ3_9FIRM|nr:hypothetical protein L21TH_1484 [Caldisalinibacter kiritimatiensis]